MKLWYSIDNPGEVRSTAVYPPSWNCINSVHKVANATLRLTLVCLHWYHWPQSTGQCISGRHESTHFQAERHWYRCDYKMLQLPLCTRHAINIICLTSSFAKSFLLLLSTSGTAFLLLSRVLNLSVSSSAAFQVFSMNPIKSLTDYNESLANQFFLLHRIYFISHHLNPFFILAPVAIEIIFPKIRPRWSHSSCQMMVSSASKSSSYQQMIRKS